MISQQLTEEEVVFNKRASIRQEFDHAAIDLFDRTARELTEAAGDPRAALGRARKEFKCLVKRHHQTLRTPHYHTYDGECLDTDTSCFMWQIIEIIAHSPPQFHLRLVRILLGPFVRYELFALDRGNMIRTEARVRNEVVRDHAVVATCASSIFHIWAPYNEGLGTGWISAEARLFAARYCVVAAMRGNAVAATREEVAATRATWPDRQSGATLLASLACYLKIDDIASCPILLASARVEFPEAVRLLSSGTLSEIGEIDAPNGDRFRWWFKDDTWGFVRGSSNCTALNLVGHIWENCTSKRGSLNEMVDVLRLFGPAQVLDLLASEYRCDSLVRVFAQLKPHTRALVSLAGPGYVKTTRSFVMGAPSCTRFFAEFGFSLPDLDGFGSGDLSRRVEHKAYLELQRRCIAGGLAGSEGEPGSCVSGNEILCRIQPLWDNYVSLPAFQLPASAVAELVVCGKLLGLGPDGGLTEAVYLSVRRRAAVVLDSLSGELCAVARPRTSLPAETLSALLLNLVGSEMSTESYRWLFAPHPDQHDLVSAPSDEPDTV